ncbi:MAG: alpha/beta hydrolase [Anaerolineae bacterium]|nr:alpha/beta hydrolase [Anaerolineae bacterium]
MPWLPLPESGERLYYALHRAEGARGPVVLVHGAGGSHLHWPAALRRLPEATVYALDLPGHGRSEGEGRRSIAAYRDVVRSFLEAAGLEQAVLVGHSMGGAIALEVALRYPRRVRGLVLVGSGARLRVAPALLQALQEDYPRAVESLVQWLFAKDAPEQLRRTARQQLLGVPPQVVYGDFLACDGFDVMGELPQVEAPTLAVCGTEDVMTPLKYSQYLAAHIPQAHLEVVPGGGHMVMLEQPEPVARAVAAFLRQLQEG